MSQITPAQQLFDLSGEVALVTGALVMILVGLIPLGRIYESIDMPVIVLVAAMLPVGEALETTGGSQLIADAQRQQMRPAQGRRQRVLRPLTRPQDRLAPHQSAHS